MDTENILLYQVRYNSDSLSITATADHTYVIGLSLFIPPLQSL